MTRRAWLAALLFLPVVSLPARDLRVEPDQQNVTSDRLFGRWEWDPVVGERMGLPESRLVLEFAAAPGDFLARLPGAISGKLKDLRFFECGVVTFEERGKVTFSGPYVLTELHGNPHLIRFRERDGVEFGDAESCNLFVAPGKEAKDDLLLLGADFDDEPFRPFRRVRDEKE